MFGKPTDKLTEDVIFVRSFSVFNTIVYFRYNVINLKLNEIYSIYLLYFGIIKYNNFTDLLIIKIAFSFMFISFDIILYE